MFEREEACKYKKGKKSFLLLVLDRPPPPPRSSDSVCRSFAMSKRKGETSIHNREHYSLSEFSRYFFFILLRFFATSSGEQQSRTNARDDAKVMGISDVEASL